MSEGEATQGEATQEQVVQAVYAFAAEQLKAGSSPDQIKATLVEKGLSQEAADAVVTNLTRVVSEAKSNAGKKNMLYGALWCIGGIVVTAVTYSSASEGEATTWWRGGRSSSAGFSSSADSRSRADRSAVPAG